MSDTLLYIGFGDTRRLERHLSMVPFFTGLYAVCGHALLATTGAQELRAVVSAVNCPTCRNVILGPLR